MPIEPSPTSSTIAPEADQEQIVREFLQKFGRGAKASAICARLAEVCISGEPTATPSQATSSQPTICDTSALHTEPTEAGGPVQPQMAMTPVKEFSSSPTRADLPATILLPAPDSIHADEVNVLEEDREEEIHDEGNSAVDDEQDDEGDDFADDEGLGDGQKDPETAEEDKDYEIRRTRRGKQPVVTTVKKLPGSEKRSEPTTAPIKVSFAQDTEDDAGEENEDSRDDSTEYPIYLPEEVVVTKKLLGEMAYFSDHKKARTYAERGTKGKQAKSGKSYHPGSLQEIESEEEFLSYISAIGFEWLLSHSTAEVPMALAKEFFTSFKFKSTTNIETDSISFCLFNVDTTMSIREWSLRLGLLTMEEDIRGEWDDRHIGPPRKTPGFDTQQACELITHQRG
ncbi:nucleolin-like [Salvia splendens]|uniref:nucleolin-like n=1 Tax=Salvia splendens TaxID=180675 RepID=UPI001C278EA3|nr:nucleolin-like [Salvia splendens]